MFGSILAQIPRTIYTDHEKYILFDYYPYYSYYTLLRMCA